MTGGAGYIGAHVVRLLVARGDAVLVVDDLTTGDEKRISGVPLVRLDLAADSAPGTLADALREHGVEAVVHLAARKSVVDSMSRPAWYYRQNLGGLLNVLEAMATAGIDRLIFSSSAAVYGNSSGLVPEQSVTEPLSPYGSTKLLGERLVTDVARSSGLRAISLRYFNVAGAGWSELGDRIVANLVPMVFERIDAGEPPQVFGDDYDTPDGTCVRDYVHVLDLAEAHLAALDHLDERTATNRIFNVGTGIGTSVRQMIEAILQESGSTLEPTNLPRRLGDPADVVAEVDRIRDELGWTSRLGLKDIVESAWASHGYFANLSEQ